MILDVPFKCLEEGIIIGHVLHAYVIAVDCDESVLEEYIVGYFFNLPLINVMQFNAAYLSILSSSQTLSNVFEDFFPRLRFQLLCVTFRSLGTGWSMIKFTREFCS